MTSGAKFTAVWYGAAVIWDCICSEGQTVSESIARWIKNRYTRWPVSALILVSVVHLFTQARRAL
jgi:hypothetical protein